MMQAVPFRQTFADYREFDECSAFTSELARNQFRWNLDPLEAERYNASLQLKTFGSAVFAEVSYDAIEGDRTPNDCTNDDRNWIILTLYEQGSAAFSCGGSDVQMQTGEILLLDGSRACSTLTSETVKCKTILFPREMAIQHLGHLEELKVQRIGRDDAPAKLLRSHIQALYQTLHQIEDRDRFAILSATLNLASLCFKPEGPENSLYLRSVFRRIEELMREHALDAELSPSRVAAHFGMTTRHLHRLFAEAGTTFSEWVRTERLVRAKRALSNKSFAGQSITQIALQFGFYDAAHFSNLFKNRYGMRPKEYRISAVAGMTH